MEKIISKEELKELRKIKGDVRGISIKADAEFILKEEGEEGLKKLEDTMVELGYPIKYRRLKAMIFYPIQLKCITLLVIKGVFNYNKERFIEMGRFASKYSWLIRTFMKYFTSLDTVAKNVSEMWRKYYTVGNFKVVEYNKEKRRGILRIENFIIHPLVCQNLIGYFVSVLQIIVGGETTCEEIKCVFRGDEYHEFLVKW